MSKLLMNGRSKTMPSIFSRNYETLDLDAKPVAPNVARQTKPRLVAKTTTTTTLDTADSGLVVIGGGVDVDGVTPLAATFRSSDAQLVCYRGDLETTTTFEMRGAVAGTRYIPRGGHVIHGTIILYCTRYEFVSGSWKSKGVSLIATQNYGETCVLLTTADGSEMQSPPNSAADARHGSSFTMGDWVSCHASCDVWFAGTDYSTTYGGGISWVCCLKRSSRGQHFDLSNAAKLKVTNYKEYESVDGTAWHNHTAIPIVKSDRIEVITFIGDTGISHTERAVFIGDHDDYMTGNWQVQEDFFGSHYGTNKFVMGAQHIGAVHAPDGSILCGGDQASALVYRMEIPEDDLTSPAKMSPIYCHNTSRELLNIFVFRSRDPLKRNGYVALTAPDGSSETPETGSVIYSTNGEHWIEVADHTIMAGNGSAAFFGEKIIVSNHKKISAIDIPETKLVPGINVEAGGDNLQADLLAGNYSGNGTWTLLSKDAQGRWLHPTTNEPIDQPPTFGPVYRYQMAEGSTFGLPQLLSIAESTHDTLGLEMFIKCIDGGAIANIGISPDHSEIAPQIQHSDWEPIFFRDNNKTLNTAKFLFISPKKSQWNNCRAVDCLIAFSHVMADNNQGYYPIRQAIGTPANSPGSNDAPEHAPHERLRITADSWNVGALLGCPTYKWDSHVKTLTDDQVLPLVTAYGDPDNWVELSLKRVGSDKLGTIILTVSKNGATTTATTQDLFIRRDSVVSVVFKQVGANTVADLRINGKLGTLTVNAQPNNQVQDIRIEGHDGTPTAIEVYGVVSKVATHDELIAALPAIADSHQTSSLGMGLGLGLG